MSANAAMQRWQAPCGCDSTIRHRVSCRLVVDNNVVVNEDSEKIRCDVEDGCIWLHVGNTLATMTPYRTETLLAELQACLQAVRKPK